MKSENPSTLAVICILTQVFRMLSVRRATQNARFTIKQTFLVSLLQKDVSPICHRDVLCSVLRGARGKNLRELNNWEAQKSRPKWQVISSIQYIFSRNTLGSTMGRQTCFLTLRHLTSVRPWYCIVVGHQ